MKEHHVCECTGCKLVRHVHAEIDKVLEQNLDMVMVDRKGTRVTIRHLLVIALMTRAAEYLVSTTLDMEEAKLKSVLAAQSFVIECCDVAINYFKRE